MISPDIVQAENGTAWLGFLFVGWPLLSLQMISTAMVIMATAAGCGFTKTGPFAFNSVLGYFLPLVIWGSWLNLHAWFMREGIRRRLASLVERPS